MTDTHLSHLNDEEFLKLLLLVNGASKPCTKSALDLVRFASYLGGSEVNLTENWSPWDDKSIIELYTSSPVRCDFIAYLYIEARNRFMRKWKEEHRNV